MSEHLANAATIRVRAASGCLRTFDCVLVDVAHGQVTAEGWWRHRGGARLRRTWPARDVEIRWSREVARAA